MSAYFAVMRWDRCRSSLANLSRFSACELFERIDVGRPTAVGPRSVVDATLMCRIEQSARAPVQSKPKIQRKCTLKPPTVGAGRSFVHRAGAPVSQMSARDCQLRSGNWADWTGPFLRRRVAEQWLKIVSVPTITVFMGGDTTLSRAIVQSAGSAYSLPSKILKQEFNTNPTMPMLMLRYTQTLITQMAQTAVCNRHHSIDQQLCRWLLLSLDRLCGNDLTMTQELIANMLGVRREGVTDAAGKLQHMGIISYSRGHITSTTSRTMDLADCASSHGRGYRISNRKPIPCSRSRSVDYGSVQSTSQLCRRRNGEAPCAEPQFERVRRAVRPLYRIRVSAPSSAFFRTPDQSGTLNFFM